MIVQYIAQPIILIGGAGSGSSSIGASGPTNTSLIGYMMAARFLFQAIVESVPGNHVPFTMGPKSKLVIAIKANAETRNMMINLFLEIFIQFSFDYLKSTLKFKVM